MAHTENLQTNSEQIYRSIVEHSIAAIFLSSPVSAEVYLANPSASKIFGYTLEEFQGKSRSMLFETDEALKNALEERNRTGKFTGIVTAIRKNGERFPCEISSVLFTDTDGELKASTTLIDISQRKAVEEALQKSNERYKLATQASFDAIWDADLTKGTVQWGEGFETLFGYKYDDAPVSGNTWEEHIHPDDKERVLGEHNRILNEEPEQHFWSDEYRFIKSNGEVACVIDRGVILRDGSGKAFRIVGAMQDKTRAKYHEELLALELNTYEISSTPGIPFSEVVLSLLKGIEEMHPDLLTTVLALNDDDTVSHFQSPRIPESYLKELDGLKFGPEVGCCIAMYRKEPVIVPEIQKDPSWSDFHKLASEYNLQACWSVPIIHHNGKVLGSFVIYYNQPKSPSELEWNTVTKIRNLFRILLENDEAMKQIRLTNERYNIISLATNDLVWDWDLNSGKIYRDPNGLKTVYGLNNNEQIDTTEKWLERVHPEDKQKVNKVMEDILSSSDRKVFDIEYRFLGSSGRYTYVYDRGIIIHSVDGKPMRMIGAAQNITDRKILEQELFLKELHKQKAISQAIIDTQEKERAEIGKELHDNVNQVLTTTKLYLDLATTDPEKLHEFIIKSSDNIKYVINEIRKLSRSLMLPSLGDLGLIESLNDLTESIQVTQKLHIECIADPEIENLLSDNQKLIIYRIIQEATNNIFKHADARSVLIHLSVSGNSLQVIVSDDGNGFDKQNVKKGAGLKNIENRVYLFNGSLEINTCPGKGCELIIQVPLLKISSVA